MLNPNEVEVGFPRVEQDDIIRYRLISSKTPDVVETRIPRQRITGVRIMHADMLGRLAKWLPQHGFDEAVPWVSGWLNPMTMTPPSPDVARELGARLRSAMGKSSGKDAWKDDAYLEAAAFCVEAWLRPD